MDMSQMFAHASSFYQNLDWCVEYDVSTTSMFYNSGCGSTYSTSTAMSRCGVSSQSYCAPPPTPSPKQRACGALETVGELRVVDAMDGGHDEPLAARVAARALDVVGDLLELERLVLRVVDLGLR